MLPLFMCSCTCTDAPSQRFLVEVFSLMFPLMILNEVGITQYNHQAIGIIETICKGILDSLY